MNAFDLLVEIDRLGISVEVDGDTLLYQGALTPKIKAQLQRHKADILKYYTAPPPDDLSDGPCPICGSRERWQWLDGRLLCRVCLVLDLVPLTLRRGDI
jgi:TubC N-terminal docking domain/Zinc-binding domain of primase-helicase